MTIKVLESSDDRPFFVNFFKVSGKVDEAQRNLTLTIIAIVIGLLGGLALVTTAIICRRALKKKADKWQMANAVTKDFTEDSELDSSWKVLEDEKREGGDRTDHKIPESEVFAVGQCSPSHL